MSEWRVLEGRDELRDDRVVLPDLRPQKAYECRVRALTLEGYSVFTDASEAMVRGGGINKLLLVVARVEGEGDDLRGDLDGEVREALRSPRHERLAMGLLVRLEAAGHEDLAQVGVSSVGRNCGARCEEQWRYVRRPSGSALQCGQTCTVFDVDIQSGPSRE